jgi:hypothetical protein
MLLVLFGVTGLLVGYRLRTSRAGYITMALTAIVFPAGQLVHLYVTRNREAMTMLPLVLGLVLVLFMFLGALGRVGCQCQGKSHLIGHCNFRSVDAATAR